MTAQGPPSPTTDRRRGDVAVLALALLAAALAPLCLDRAARAVWALTGVGAPSGSDVASLLVTTLSIMLLAGAAAAMLLCPASTSRGGRVLVAGAAAVVGIVPAVAILALIMRPGAQEPGFAEMYAGVIAAGVITLLRWVLSGLGAVMMLVALALTAGNRRPRAASLIMVGGSALVVSVHAAVVIPLLAIGAV